MAPFTAHSITVQTAGNAYFRAYADHPTPRQTTRLRRPGIERRRTPSTHTPGSPGPFCSTGTSRPPSACADHPTERFRARGSPLIAILRIRTTLTLDRTTLSVNPPVGARTVRTRTTPRGQGPRIHVLPTGHKSRLGAALLRRGFFALFMQDLADWHRCRPFPSSSPRARTLNRRSRRTRPRRRRPTSS